MKKLKKAFDNNTLHGKILRFSLVILLFAGIFVGGYFILRATGLNSIAKIQEVVKKGGGFSVAIFILFQILQTTVLQIPAIIVTIAGAWVFGPFPSFCMSYFAVMVGSIIMFIIGRKAGRPFLNWMIGKDTAQKWIDKMSEGKYLFFLMMVFPMFPDDILCCVAGLTQMGFGFFFWTNVIARGLGLLCTVYLGRGEIIPFKGWGLIVWAVLIVIMAVLFYLSVRFKDKLDELFFKIFKRKSKANANENVSEAQSIKDQQLSESKPEQQAEELSMQPSKVNVVEEQNLNQNDKQSTKKRKKVEKVNK